MDATFWRERWSQGQTSFHRGEVNPQLIQHWGALDAAPDAHVFVPLCGKSLDLGWLRSQGHPVLGVEVSDIAVAKFFAESGIACTTRREGAFDVSEGGGIRIDCGDFFDLQPEDLHPVRAVYDRAAFVALPPDWRERYARHMCEILPESASILMITFEYDAPGFSGPPFSIPEQEVRALYGDSFHTEILERSEPLPAPPHLAERGLTTFRDSVYRLSRLR